MGERMKKVVSMIIAVSMLIFGVGLLTSCKKNKSPSYDYSINISITKDGIIKFKQPKVITESGDECYNNNGRYYKYYALNNSAETFLSANDIPSESDGDYYIMSYDVKKFGNYEVGEPYTFEVERHNAYLGYLYKYYGNNYETYVRKDYGVDAENDIQFTVDENGNFMTLSEYYSTGVKEITTLYPLEECLTVGCSTITGNAFVVNMTNGKQIEFAIPLNFTNQINTGASGTNGTATYKIGNKTFTYNYSVADVNANITSSNGDTKYYTINNIDVGKKSSVSIGNYYGTTSAEKEKSHNVVYTAFSKSGLNSIKHVKQLACYIDLKAGDLEGFNNLETLIISTGGVKIYELFNGNIPASLKTVMIHYSDSIPDYFFYGCSGLKNVYMSSRVSSVSENSFAGLGNVENMIVSGRFELDSEYLTGLKNVRISYGSSNVTGNFILNNSQIESVIMPDTVEEVGNYSFSKVTNLKSFRISNGLTHINTRAFEDFDYDKELRFSNVDTIESWAFQCSTVPKISFTDSLASVGEYAFYGCSNLQTLIMPSANANISHMSALLGETNVKELHISGAKPIHELYNQPTNNDFTLAGSYKLEKLVVYGNICSEFAKELNISGKTIEIILDDSVKTIGANAFENTNLFTTLNTNRVEKILDKAFYQNTTLTNLDTTTSLIYVGTEAFTDSSFVSGKDIVIIGDGVLIKYTTSSNVADLRELSVKYIMNGVFGNGLKEITLGESVKYLEDGAFKNATGLEKLTIYSDNIDIIVTDNNSGLFYRCTKLANIYVNLSDLSHYQNASHWSKYSSKFAPIPL